MNKPIYGLLAEFDNPTALVNAARTARERGYRKLDAYSPFPIEELSDALHLHKNRLPLIVLIGGILGGSLGYLLQYYVTVWYFPINIAGRPLNPGRRRGRRRGGLAAARPRLAESGDRSRTRLRTDC